MSTARRSYRFTDAQLVELATTTQNFFDARIGDFQMYDTKISSAWFDELLEKGRDVTRDDFERSLLRRQTEDVLTAMQACVTVMREVRYIVKRAFAKGSSARLEFNLSAFSEASNSQREMIEYMKRLKKRVFDYRDTLTNAGASEGFFDRVATAADDVDTLNEEQESTKTIRKINTAERIESLNELYEGLRRIEELAAVAYEPGTKEYGIFKLPVRSTTVTIGENIVGEETPTDAAGDLPTADDEQV